MEIEQIVKKNNEKNEEIVLITGATDGIGKATLIELLNRSLHVIVIARNIEKFRKMFSNIQQKSHIDFYQADLSQVSEILRVSDVIKKDHARIDILINNVGGFFTKRIETEEGFELTFALNYLGPVLLSHLMINKLMKSANPQIIFISSSSHRMGELHFKDFQLNNNYHAIRAYSQSKLAGLYFIRKMAHLLEPYKIRINAIHPGIVKTNLGNGEKGIQNVIFTMLKKTVAISTEKAGFRIAELALSKKYELVTGKYISKTKIKEPHIEKKKEKEFAGYLWDRTWDLLLPLINEYKSSIS